MQCVRFSLVLALVLAVRQVTSAPGTSSRKGIYGEKVTAEASKESIYSSAYNPYAPFFEPFFQFLKSMCGFLPLPICGAKEEPQPLAQVDANIVKPFMAQITPIVGSYRKLIPRILGSFMEQESEFMIDGL